jgi:hypothetical protein
MKSTHVKSKSKDSEKHIIAPRNSVNTPVRNSFVESESVQISNSIQQESIYDELNILKFYTIKLNDIFSSFFIKYFNKLKDNYDTLKEFQMFLRNNEKEDIDKGLHFFDTYIDKKYKLSFEDLNTSIYIYIKESLQKILNKKVMYESRSEQSRNHLLKTLFFKCFKHICTNLYENPNSINHPLDLKKNIIQSVKYTLYNIIPFDYTIKHYDDNNVDDVNLNIKNTSNTDKSKEKKNDSVKKYFYSDNENNKISSNGLSKTDKHDKKNKKSNKSYLKKKNKSNTTNTISDMSYEHDSS